ncbi:hypothetical protein NQ035_10430 [Staphylococcus gallinarum]|uniref:Uncharacterized protein n=2 Tax=Staphylococcus gallinarum TaxID=1293 RepID=A0A2T4SVJ2_STAGA|nr:hypothetical protein [Staphylococcus gallinarum]MCD8786524.1 hypothetical protein [Staphylococcus gallinarum]MCD8821164.1 hypothetical protein [Staphylococcus gallinarum]MCD8825248.1 hypothetical protein [Staphylococcus gallinarum]MCD8843557.1 hypothetical protein [Staphylococcus gallinarum]MCD8859432.1 hypothetical protein [Staphylococcus gallinarum]
MEKFGLWIRRIAILALTCLLIQGVIRMIMQYFGWPPYDKPLLIVGAAMVLLSELIKNKNLNLLVFAIGFILVIIA